MVVLTKVSIVFCFYQGCFKTEWSEVDGHLNGGRAKSVVREGDNRGDACARCAGLQYYTFLKFN